MEIQLQHETAVPATSVDVAELWRLAVQGNAEARTALLRRILRRHDAPEQPLDERPTQDWATERLAEVLAV